MNLRTHLGALLRQWLILWLTCLSALAANAQVSQDWMVSTPNTYGRMLALDKANNAYVAGAVPWSSITLTKYSPTGSVLWQRSFSNPSTGVRPSWVTVDSAGNAIVVGSIVRATGLNPFGRIVLKYDAAGNLLWQEVIQRLGTGTDRVLTDAANNVYVLGNGLSELDNITMKYAPDGTRLWQRTGNGPVSFPSAMALTRSNQLLIAGNILLRGTVAAYDPAGSLIWSKSTAASTVSDIAVGPSGEIVVAGGDYTNVGVDAFLVVKYDANFNELWRRSYPVGKVAAKLGVDSKGNVIVTGTTGNYFNWMTIKLDPNGNQLWSRTYDEHRFNDEIPYFLVVGPDDAAYLTGQGGPGPTSGTLSYLRMVTLKYAADGSLAWVMSTFDSVRGLALRLGSDNNVYVVGESPQTVVRYRQTTAANQLPTAVATADKTTGASPLGVNFSSAGSFDPDGTIVAYEWNFGDGSTSIQPNPYHVYGPGTYTATLKVFDDRAASATSAPLTIRVSTVLPAPTALSLSPSTVVGGRSVKATVTLSSYAGGIVSLSSSKPGVATVPATVLVPAGSNSASFTVQTTRVTARTSVVISARTGALLGKSATLTVVPAGVLAP